ncbi:triggering receptor expressed on myeloid cells 3-like isoform X2 [Dasypus novemcinctus]|uniref:triggering receptor expressed on myeloid cells 3-like isoform X2 n=1 Tax=Dasypus novemcinctus TaxID=9361 RepID=UPI00265DA0B7|nr:triggering receptor expressed on myeloid cells 3-like isoform X2 [Dasypus novemcinctus]
MPWDGWQTGSGKGERMDGTGLQGWPRLLLLLLYVSGFEAVGVEEEPQCLIEGENLTVRCPYNIVTYSSSAKAWQRVGSQGPPVTLVRVEAGDKSQKQAQTGWYLLEDYPTEAMVRVTKTELGKQDLGLYQCVVDLSPRDSVILHDRIRLVECNGRRAAEALPVLGVVLTCGFLLSKGLVFSVLSVLVWKTWASGEAAS